MKGNVSRRDAALALFLAGLMLAAIWLSARQDVEGQAPPPLTSYSSGPDGARALALWLEELGYAVRRAEGVNLRVDRSDELLLVLEPQQTFSAGEVETVDAWVRAGGTLVVATSRWYADSLLEHFELGVDPFDATVDLAIPAQPLLMDPSWDRAQVRVEHYFVTERDDIVVHLRAAGNPVLLSFSHGDGRVFVTTAVHPFSNAGLRHDDNSRLIYNLVALAGPGGQVVFDESVGHGYREARTLFTWLKTTAQGHSLLYAGGVVFLYLLIGGRRLGRPISLARAATRRAPVEYIQAMANLYRRGGKRTAILHHYHDVLRRELARAFRLDPMLDDEALAARVALARPDVDPEALLALLQGSAEKINESELLSFAQEVDGWTKKIG